MTPARVGVVGLGLIGGSIAKRLAELPAEYEPIGFDLDDATSAEAGSADIQIASSIEEAAKGAELVVVATPPKHTASVIAAVLAADQDVLVTDVASVKAPIVNELGDEERYLPSHPLAGAESSGWSAARPDLLDATTWAVCPPSNNAPAELLCRFAKLFDAFAARLIVCDPEEHDRAVARTSHAPHVVAAAIAASLAGQANPQLAAALSGGAFRDVTRVAGSDPAMWREILELNGDNVAAALADLRAALEGQPAWEGGREVARLVDALRWHEPAWERRELDWPAWEALLELGRDGRAVRRPSQEGERLAVDVAVHV